MAVVMITGCSTGFGRAAALDLAGRGHTVAATMRDLRKADGLDAVEGIELVQLDVTDSDSRDAAVSEIVSRRGRVDVLVNNAGISALGPAQEMPNEIVRQQFDTNFFGPFALMKAVLPSMIENAAGRIVNVTSIGALLASGFYSVYCATKHALDALTLGMDIELQQFGIRAVTVVPGGFNTAIAQNRIPTERPDTHYPQAAVAISAYEERLAPKTDLTPVTDAIAAAAFDPDPRARYLIGEGTARMLEPVVSEGEAIHRALRARDLPAAPDG